MSQISDLEKKAFDNLIASVRLLEACRTIREFMPESTADVMSAQRAARKALPIDSLDANQGDARLRRGGIQVVEHPQLKRRGKHQFGLVNIAVELIREKGPMSAKEIAAILAERGMKPTGLKSLAGQVGQSMQNRAKHEARQGHGELRRIVTPTGRVTWALRRKYNKVVS